MLYKNLEFFDKFGHNLNLEYDNITDSYSGTVYFPRVPIDLYENQHVFILEKVLVGTDKKYTSPLLGVSGVPSIPEWRTRWETRESEDNIFTYLVDDIDGTPFIKRTQVQRATLDGKNYTIIDGYKSVQAGDLDESAFQINIALTSKDEDIYERTLIIEDMSVSQAGKVIARLKFWGETVGEDERLKHLLDNFGRHFNMKDAKILKDYDMNEALPDWKHVNEKRKEMLIAYDEIFPYTGSYKGLVNIIRFFGYQELRVKEYWLNVNQTSENFGKYKHVQLDKLLQGAHEPKLKNPLIPSVNYKKSNKFGLFYDINRVTGGFDQLGIPLVENASIFTNEEVLVKLYALKEKLKKEFMPLNTRIVDIVGEGIYFERYGIKSWTDELRTFSTTSGSDIDIEAEPRIGYIRDLRELQTRTFPNGLLLPEERFDEDEISIYDNIVDPFAKSQRYLPHELPGLLSSIRTFYDSKKKFRFPNLWEKNFYKGDEPNIPAGMPVIFKIVLDPFTWNEMKVTWDNVDSVFTMDNIDFSNLYEIEWIIEKAGEKPYKFSISGKLEDYKELPHFLPYEGTYKVTAIVLDLFNNRSVQIREDLVEVRNFEIEISAFTRFRNYDEYIWDNVHNSWNDYGCAWNNIIEGDQPITTPLNTMILNYPRYKYQDVDVYNYKTNTWEPIRDSNVSNTKQWGTDNMTWENIDTPMDEMFSQTWDMLDFHGTFLGGFSIFGAQASDSIRVGDYPEYVLQGPFTDLYEVAIELNATSNEGIRLFDYVYRDNELGPHIHASAKLPGPLGWNFIYYTGNITGDAYSFRKPTWQANAERIMTEFLSNYPDINPDSLFLDAPLEAHISGDALSYEYWEEQGFIQTNDNRERRGHLPSWAGQGSWTTGDVRVYQDRFVVPMGCPVFFVSKHSEIPGKKDSEWELYFDSGNTSIIRVKSDYFIYRFSHPGTYTLKNTVKDTHGNISTQNKIGFVRVLTKTEFDEYLKKGEGFLELV
jgi:hypothetical protein